MPLTMLPASTTDAAALYGDPGAGDAALQSGSRSGASLRASDGDMHTHPSPAVGSGHSPSVSNEQSLSSAHSVPDPHQVSPSDKRRDTVSNGLPALVTNLDSPDVTSARSPGAQNVRSMRQAYRESQDHSLRHVPDGIDHGREPAAPFEEPEEPIDQTDSMLGMVSLCRYSDVSSFCCRNLFSSNLEAICFAFEQCIP